MNLRFSTLSMQAEHLERTCWSGAAFHGRSPGAAGCNGIRPTPAAGRGSTELQRLLDEMGEVNLMAIDECAGMEERFTFLSRRRKTWKSRCAASSRPSSASTAPPASVSRKPTTWSTPSSRRSFPRLFCGGRAELRLTDEEDLLETGIDIIVQPPGKKLQNVTLLSGGEKALTAVALIFSIFLIKPTPFCLLDEVDAPLDDANIGRFNEMVREMCAVSQFIIITHNKPPCRWPTRSTASPWRSPACPRWCRSGCIEKGSGVLPM